MIVARVKQRAEKVVVGAVKAYAEVVTVVPCAAGIVYPLPTDAAWIVEIRPWLSQPIPVDIVCDTVMPACPRCSKVHSAYVADLYGDWCLKVGR